jgi:hypothetical protein
LFAISCAAVSPASASFPSPSNSTVPACFNLVGSSAGAPAQAAGSFDVVVRDLANNPVQGAHVVVDLSGCPDLHFCADQLDPSVDVDCALKMVGKFTDPNGRATFVLLGGSNGAGNASTLLNGGKIFRNGVLLGSPTVGAYDLDGSGGVGASDLSAWLSDFASGIPFGRSDYDCSFGVGASDLSLWLTAFGSGQQAESCTATCP